MTNDVKYQGALTFEDEDEMAEALAKVEAMLAEHPNSLLPVDELKSLGLHLTINYTTTGNSEQIENSEAVIYKLAAEAYSGYIDMTSDGEQKRFHAKEIEPKHVQLSDIVD